MLRQTQRKEIEARIAELESQQDALLEGQDQERLESPAPAPEQERRERQRRCNHAWRGKTPQGKTPKCKWGKCAWVPFEGRIIRAYVDRRKSQPKPSASVEEIAARVAKKLGRLHENYQFTQDRVAGICTAAIEEATAPVEAENARLSPLQESFNQCCDENARLREALRQISTKAVGSADKVACLHTIETLGDMARATLKGDE